ncbi:hypothetical protein THAOC_34536, partial [Thalassiosira oceanica]
MAGKSSSPAFQRYPGRGLTLKSSIFPLWVKSYTHKIGEIAKDEGIEGSGAGGRAQTAQSRSAALESVHATYAEIILSAVEEQRTRLGFIKMKSEFIARPVSKTSGLKRKASGDGGPNESSVPMLPGGDSVTGLTVSFRCTKLKLVTKKLLVLQGRCVNGWINRLKPNNPALLHVAATSCRLPQDVESVETLATTSQYFLSNKSSIERFYYKGCWTEMDNRKLVVVKVRENMELNRRGDRVAQCIDVLAVQEAEDESIFPVDYDDVFHQYMLPKGTAVANPICPKSERHIVFCDWIVKTFGSCLNKGSGVLDVAGGNGLISRTLSEKYGVKCTLIDPNPRCYNKRYSKDDSRYLPPFDVIAEPLNGNGELLQSKGGPIRKTIRNCSLIIGLHPDQATEPIVELALSLRVPFAIIP